MVLAVVLVLWIFIILNFLRGNLHVLRNRLRLLTGIGLEPFRAMMQRELQSRNRFYGNLSAIGRQQMIDRCVRFALTKRFTGAKGLKVTNEMVAAISATAAQITFGLKRFELAHYRNIIIFPVQFYSPLHKRDLKGGASTKGTLMFSWADYVQGNEVPDDRMNLGLHEMAHALRLELRYGSGADRRLADYFDKWFRVAYDEFLKIRDGQSSFLRSYAGSNAEEFFAVCVEHFFEAPEAFSKELPDVYVHLCFLLNQDPLNVDDDFAFNRRLVLAYVNGLQHQLPDKIERNYRYDAWHWSFNMIIGGFFLAASAVYYLGSMVVIPVDDALLVMAVVSAIMISFRGFWFRWGIQLFRHLVLFALVGVSVPVLALSMLLNYAIHDIPKVSTYNIVDCSERPAGNNLRVRFQLQGDVFDDAPRFRQTDLTLNELPFASSDRLEISTSRGLFGWTNINRRVLIMQGYRLDIGRPEL